MDCLTDHIFVHVAFDAQFDVIVFFFFIQWKAEQFGQKVHKDLGMVGGKYAWEWD